MDSLKKKIASLPKQGTWNESTLTLTEDPTVEHQIQYRDPLDVIKSLWSNPTYADQMVFSPRQMWSSRRRKSRLYNEMWTGDWWWETQVCI